MATFNTILHHLRKQANLTQTQLAEKLELSYSTISMYERGDRKPDMATMLALSDLFGVSLDYLHGRTNENGFGISHTPGTADLTPHEKTVISAYRSRPSMQPAVDRLLGIEED